MVRLVSLFMYKEMPIMRALKETFAKVSKDVVHLTQDFEHVNAKSFKLKKPFY